ncbi:putative zinc-binding protein [Rheinheimera faecalis]|uniref:putative zinc-binding protein n=1 Tax=Rheinheimera faecalis TaxID=2901141 RepID=UPI001B680CFC|nr:putative zinc-binding protein [Rheinheimera faecalis]MBP8226748.1 putative zinc-binding protein [Rheinheimera sp.]
MATKSDKPLVYACSGCSKVAQLANDLAVVLDREGIAEMSCIAGVGGQVKPLVRIAKSGRNILAIDGCPLNCVKRTLACHQVVPTWHLELTSFETEAMEKGQNELQQAYKLLQHIQQDILPPASYAEQVQVQSMH